MIELRDWPNRQNNWWTKVAEFLRFLQKLRRFWPSMFIVWLGIQFL
jgi:hypothetical protein